MSIRPNNANFQHSLQLSSSGGADGAPGSRLSGSGWIEHPRRPASVAVAASDRGRYSSPLGVRREESVPAAWLPPLSPRIRRAGGALPLAVLRQSPDRRIGQADARYTVRSVFNGGNRRHRRLRAACLFGAQSHERGVAFRPSPRDGGLARRGKDRNPAVDTVRNGGPDQLPHMASRRRSESA